MITNLRIFKESRPEILFSWRLFSCPGSFYQPPGFFSHKGKTYKKELNSLG